MRPTIVANYTNQSGIVYIDRMTIEEVVNQNAIAPGTITQQVSTTTFGSSNTLTDPDGSSGAASGVIATASFPNTDLGSEILVNWIGRFDAISYGGTASSRSNNISIGSDNGFTQGADLYSNNHGGVPIPAGQFALSGSYRFTANGAAFTAELTAATLSLQSGQSSTFSYAFSNFTMTLTELKR